MRECVEVSLCLNIYAKYKPKTQQERKNNSVRTTTITMTTAAMLNSGYNITTDNQPKAPLAYFQPFSTVSNTAPFANDHINKHTKNAYVNYFVRF
mmetsp:Transcript_14776/g.30116  ORF Transcript_14776/g.30116 Transcript_14776/m.30116 type:complete len:95 (+) Transcript_14776:546-830(+)